jgi:hypothetical protein
MSHTQSFVWFDLNTPNVDESIDFYTAVLPWETEQWEGGDTPYTMWTAGGTPLGGLMQMPEEARQAGVPPHWLGYVEVEELDDALDQLEELGGGKISGKVDLGEAGQMCVVEDPQGAVFALHHSSDSSEPGMEPPAKNEPGAVSWCEVTVDDVDEGWEFYREMFGWEEQMRMEAQPGVPYQIFGWDGEQMGGVSAKPDGHDIPSHWLFYVTVADIEAACDRVTDHDGEVINGPMDVPGGDRVAHARDPFGGMFALQQPGQSDG